MATNIGRMFPKILDEEFPENQMFHKIFNLNTVKISYSCMPNFKENVDGSKKSTLQKTNTPPGLKNIQMPDISRLPYGRELPQIILGLPSNNYNRLTTCQPKLMLESLRRLLKHDLPITTLLLATPTRDLLQGSVSNCLVKEEGVKFKITWKIWRNKPPLKTCLKPM